MAFKILRITAGLTQKEMAEKLGLDQTTISAWEVGKATPTIKNVKKLSALLSVTTDEIIAALESGSGAAGNDK